MRIVVTGANGFIGRAVCQAAIDRGISVYATTRDPYLCAVGITNVVVGALDTQTNWTRALSNVDVVIHLAARVHIMHERTSDPLSEFRRVNTDATRHLAQSAAAQGVKRIVYVSTIKVNGEETHHGQRYTETDSARPQDAYAISKWEAEQALQQVSIDTGLEVTIVRPPLVYGTDVKGNFAHMLRVVKLGLPLPLASVSNQRDLIYLGNFVDALLHCAHHPNAGGQTYLVSDGVAISTPELLRQIGYAMHVTPHLLPCPLSWLTWGGKLLGLSAQLDRLLGSLQIDSSKIRHQLGWQAPFTLEQGLQAMFTHPLHTDTTP